MKKGVLAEMCFRAIAFLSWWGMCPNRSFAEFTSLPVLEPPGVDDMTYLISGDRSFVYDAWLDGIPAKVRIECGCGGHSGRLEVMKQPRYKQKRLRGRCLKCGQKVSAMVMFL